MEAVPRHVSGKCVDPSGRYTCPLCSTQRAGDIEDIGWVACPMVDGAMICLGCCLDHASAARSLNFYEHLDYELFESLGDERGTTAVRLRSTCLQHQSEIVIQMERDAAAIDMDAIAELQRAIRRASDDVERECERNRGDRG